MKIDETIECELIHAEEGTLAVRWVVLQQSLVYIRVKYIDGKSVFNEDLHEFRLTLWAKIA